MNKLQKLNNVLTGILRASVHTQVLLQAGGVLAKYIHTYTRKHINPFVGFIILYCHNVILQVKIII